jgi:hypothetical protein
MVELRGSYSPEEEKAVLRKIDLVILPFVSGSTKDGSIAETLLVKVLQEKDEAHLEVCVVSLRKKPSFSCNTLTSRVSAMLPSLV